MVRVAVYSSIRSNHTAALAMGADWSFVRYFLSAEIRYGIWQQIR